MNEEVSTPEAEVKPQTPAAIVLGLYLMLIGAASPFLSEAHNFLAGNHGKNGLGVFLGWFFFGVVAALIGVVCTLIGCTQQPRTRLTHVAVMIALVEIIVGGIFLVTM